MINFLGNTNSLKSKKKAIKIVLKTIIADHKKKLNQIDYVFVNDEELLKINQQALSHDYYTDIITFDYGEGDKIESEIYISLDRVEENATNFNETFHVELIRVIIHGVLHLVGYKDKTKKDKEMMREKENQYIEQYLKVVPRGT
jgi:probable rRNA maturation factor